MTSDVKMGNLEDDVPEPSVLKCKKGKKVGCARPLGQTGYAPFVPSVAFTSIFWNGVARRSEWILWH
jgi:hypothetical protein